MSERSLFPGFEPGIRIEGLATDETCGTCANCCRVHYHCRTYHKCALRAWTHGKGTDIRLKDTACVCWVSGERQEVTGPRQVVKYHIRFRR